MSDEAVSGTDLNTDFNTPADDNPLSEREMDVARHLATGASNAEIARELVISPHTVKVHVRNIYEKLQVSSRTEASMLLIQKGWIIVPGVEMPVAEALGGQAPAMTDPEPLADRPPQPLPWQTSYLVGALVACLLLLAAPLLVRPSLGQSIVLTDAGQVALGQPQLATLPRWEVRTPLPAPRSRLATATLADRIYVLGGEGPGGATAADLHVYDLRVNEWNALAPLPLPLANAAAVALRDHLYVAGGSHNAADGAATISDKLLVYRIAEDEWEDGGTLPGPLAGAVLVSYGQAIYLLGGWDGTTVRDEIWRLPVNRTEGQARANWELVARLDLPRAFFGATVVGDDLYVAGGYDGTQELGDAAVYNLAEGVWLELPPLSTPRGGLSLVYDGLAVVALGGGLTYSIDNHERYDPATGVWSNFPSPIQGQWRHLAAAASDGRLHLIGGWGGDYLDAHLQYQSSFRALLPVLSND